MTIKISDMAGKFAENKDAGREIRIQQILPALEKGEDVILNFAHVESATQSFVHSLISDVLRKHGDEVLERMTFKSCNDSVRGMIKIVVEYMQDAMEKEKTQE